MFRAKSLKFLINYLSTFYENQIIYVQINRTIRNVQRWNCTRELFIFSLRMRNIMLILQYIDKQKNTVLLLHDFRYENVIVYEY